MKNGIAIAPLMFRRLGLFRVALVVFEGLLFCVSFSHRECCIY